MKSVLEIPRIGRVLSSGLKYQGLKLNWLLSFQATIIYKGKFPVKCQFLQRKLAFHRKFPGGCILILLCWGNIL